jgi:hypothetical protein
VDLLLPLTSIAGVTSGIGLIYLGWLGKLPALPAKICGWAVILVSGVTSVLAWGPNFGPVYLGLFVSLAASLFVALEAEPRVAKVPWQRTKLPTFNLSGWATQIAMFLFVFLIGGLASLNSAVLLGLMMPGELVDGMALAVLVTPVLWGGAFFWATAYWGSARVGLPLIVVLTLLMLFIL